LFYEFKGSIPEKYLLKSSSENSKSFFRNEKITSNKKDDLHTNKEIEQSHKQIIKDHLNEILNEKDKALQIKPNFVKYDEIYVKKPNEDKKEKIVIKQTFDPTLVDKIFNDLLLNYIIEKNNLDFDLTVSSSLKEQKSNLANDMSGEVIKPEDQRWDPLSIEPKSIKKSTAKPSLKVSWGE
jgi:hypothetical protein